MASKKGDMPLLLERLMAASASDLVAYQIEKEVKFGAEHRDKLAAVQRAVNPHVAPVADSAGDAVLLSVQPHERLEIFHVFRTSDVGFNRACTALAALCEEVEFLRRTAKAKFYAQLSLFGHSKHDDADEYSDGIIEAMMGRALPLFQDAANYVSRLNAVVLNIVRQLQALFGRGSGFAAGFREVRLRPVVLALGDALTVLETLDAIIVGNKVIAPAWEKYKRLADVMRGDPARYGVEEEKANAFDSLLSSLDTHLLSGNLVRQCLDQQFEITPDSTGVYRDWLRDRALENIDIAVGALGSELETIESRHVVGQFGVYALYRTVSGGRVLPEILKKQFEKLWKLVEICPIVQLYGRSTWMLDKFLAAYCPVPGLVFSKLNPKNPDAVRTTAADTIEANLGAATNIMHTRVTAWLVRADMAFADAPLVSNQPPMDILRARAILLNQALCLAYGGSRTLNMYFLMQLTLGRNFKRKCVECVTRLCELLKVIEGALRAHAAALGETVVHVHRDNAIAIMDLFLPLRLKASAQKKSDDALKFVAAATELVQSLCLGSESWSKLRRIALDLGLSVGLQPAAISKETETRDLLRASWQLDMLSDYQQHAREACDCTMLYWARELMPVMVAGVCTLRGTSPSDADSRHGSRLQYLFTAFSDAARMLALAVHLPPPPHAARRLVPDILSSSTTTTTTTTDGAGGNSSDAIVVGAGAGKPAASTALADIEHVLTAFERYLHGIIAADVIAPLVRAVEADLRVTVHAVHLAHMEPPALRTGRPPLVHLLALPPIRIVGALVDIRSEVTHALEKTFYELTTVALHDWKTYGEMASLAAHKYGIALTDNHLPMGCLDAGLDVLQIMRNIHVFVARYNYNMNQQFFVEKKSVKGGKHLNIVTIQSISASIRQHGSGMMNTTVNFAYQFLAQKFHVFAQFLYDDYIKSYLAKERRFYRRERKALDNRYPHDHAAALCKDIRSLGMTADKLSFLDKFRSLISDIGNTLGYVRMVRTAGMRAAAEAVKFVPDLENIISFEEAAKKVTEEAMAVYKAEYGETPASESGLLPPRGLSDETIDAARQLDAVLKNLTASFAEGSDYFKLLVSVFQHVLLGASATAGGGGKNGSGGGGGGATTSASSSSSSTATTQKLSKDSDLRNFFLIVPALTLSFVTNLRSSKDRMEKSIKGTESFFCDDGFAMGIAYILAILKQDRQFESLHWWDAVLRYHRAELASYKVEQGSLGKTKADADRAEELAFKTRRVLTEQAEFDQLYYSYQGARAFFKMDGSTEDDEVLVAV